ncbi:MAG: dienelactone hydrolase family protein [Firmicutes bacterium]|nr:dienelactone hydrolase family protein [Bacillota bacterium]
MIGEYSGYDYILNMFENSYRQEGFKGKTQLEHKKWVEASRKRLMGLMGMHNMEKCKLSPVTLEIKTFGDYLREKIVIKTQDNLKMPFYILSPLAGGNKKAIIAIHGHGSDGKEGLVGNEKEEYKEKVKRFNYVYAMQLVKMGFTVFVPDLLGSGERTLGIYKDTTAECNDINNACVSLGFSLQGLVLFDLMRLVDYIKEYTETEGNLGVCGFSGGGNFSILLAAMDERIDYCLDSGFFHSYKDVLLYTNRCGCNFVPNLWKYFDMCDIASMVAPRPLFIETGIRDTLNGARGIGGVEEQISIAQQTYRLYGMAITVSMQEGEHTWHGSGYKWINTISSL